MAFALVLPAQTGTYEQAVALVRSGDFSNAISAIEKLLATQPGELRSRNLLGIALSGAGRRAEANKHFEYVLKANPAFLPALKNLAHNQLELGQLQAAREHFNAALKLAPADPSIHFGLGRLAFANRDYGAAVEHYQKSNNLYLNEPLALIQYAASCVEARMPDKARAALTALRPDVEPGVQFEAGVLLARMEQYEEAAGRFELARAGSSAGSFDAYRSGFNLALAYLKGGKAVDAIHVAEQTLRNAAPTAELYSLVAEAYEKTGSTQKAYEALRAAVRLNPQEEGAYVQLIALCLNHENQELGLEIANLGVNTIPASTRLRLQRGVIHALNGRSTDALADFRSVAKLNPDAPLAYVAEALMLLRMDQNLDAVALLRKRANERPGDHLANWMLAEALVKLGPEAGASAEQEAIAALERSVKTEARMPQSRMLLGKMLLARGEAQRARVELEKAIELDAGNTTAAYLLAQAYRKAGRTQEANRLFAKVQEAKAEDPAQDTGKALLRIVRDTVSTTASGAPTR